MPAIKKKSSKKIVRALKKSVSPKMNLKSISAKATKKMMPKSTMAISSSAGPMKNPCSMSYMASKMENGKAEHVKITVDNDSAVLETTDAAGHVTRKTLTREQALKDISEMKQRLIPARLCPAGMSSQRPGKPGLRRQMLDFTTMMSPFNMLMLV